MISDGFIQDLKHATDIHTIVSSYLELKKKGRLYFGVCPFHSEKSPSMAVYQDTQSFYCFGCGAGGDVVTFVKKIENLEYIEAIKLLADKAGLRVPDDTLEDKTVFLKTKILEINRETAKFFYSNLKKQNCAGMAYLKSRGLSNTIIKKFGLGFANDSWTDLLDFLRKKGYSFEELKAANIISEKNAKRFDTFRNRVSFPIIDLRGNVVGFGARVLDNSMPKYLNSSDSLVFKKSHHLFGLNLAKNTASNTVILVEGYLDVIALFQAGFENSVATLGTAITSEQARLIGSYFKNVIIAYDSDLAGQTATKKAIHLLSQVDVAIKVIKLEGAKDPDEFIKKFGVDRFRSVLENSANAIDFEIHKLKLNYDLSLSQDKVDFLKEFVKYISEIENPIERDVYIAKIASELDAQKSTIFMQVEQLIARKKKAHAKKKNQNLSIFSENNKKYQKDLERSKNIKYALCEDKIICALIKNPDFYKIISLKVTPEDFVTSKNKLILQAIYLLLEKNIQPDLIHLSSILGDELTGIVSFLLSNSFGTHFTMDQIDDYISNLLEYKTHKTKEQVACMDDDEYRLFFENLKK